MSSDSAAADAAQGDLLAAYSRALIGTSYPSFEGVLSLFGAADVAYTQSKTNLENLQPRIDDWTGKLRRWADAGQRDDGSAYSYAEWFAYGKDLASAISLYSKETVNADRFVAAGASVAQDVSDVGSAAAAVANVSAWPSWVPWAIGAAAAVGLLWVVRPYVGLLRGSK